jgi:hypothetical protein
LPHLPNPAISGLFQAALNTGFIAGFALVPSVSTALAGIGDRIEKLSRWALALAFVDDLAAALEAFTVFLGRNSLGIVGGRTYNVIRTLQTGVSGFGVYFRVSVNRTLVATCNAILEVRARASVLNGRPRGAGAQSRDSGCVSVVCEGHSIATADIGGDKVGPLVTLISEQVKFQFLLAQFITRHGTHLLAALHSGLHSVFASLLLTVFVGQSLQLMASGVYLFMPQF